MNDRRWWLWTYDDTEEDAVYSFPSKGGSLPKSCTEVRLVPVEESMARKCVTLDDVIGTDGGLVTLSVAPDSLEAAIAGTRRGERWETTDGYLLRLGAVIHMERNGLICRNVPTTGWRRVEETLRCPACGSEVSPVEKDGGDHRWWFVECLSCAYRVNGIPRGWRTEAEAREAFRKMGGGK